MACGSFLGRFPFTLQVASGQECYLRLTSPLLRTGGYELSYAMTLVRVTDNVVAIPATETSWHATM